MQRRTYRWIAVFGLMLFCATTSWGEDRYSGLVILVQGKATLKRAGKTSPLKKDMLVVEGDWIETQAASRVGLQLSSGISTQIGPKTKIQILTLSKDKQNRKIQMQLQHGSLASKAKADGRLEMKVETPTLVAAVRGTEFLVDARGSENTVAVNEGEVAVSSETNQVKETTVAAGQKIIATAEGVRKEILDRHDKERFRMLQSMESMKKAQFEAYTDQLRRNEALRQHMKQNMLPPN